MACSLSRTLGHCEVVLGKGWNERVGRTKWGTNATSGVLVATWAARSRCDTYLHRNCQLRRYYEYITLSVHARLACIPRMYLLMFSLGALLQSSCKQSAHGAQVHGSILSITV